MISNAKYHEHENYLTHKQNTPNDIKSKTCNSWKHHKVVTSFNIFAALSPQSRIHISRPQSNMCSIATQLCRQMVN